MSTVVCFKVGDGDYAIAVESVREVRSGDQLMPLPAPRAGVVGLLQHPEGALTVLAALGPGRDHVLLLQHGERTFGLVVEEVTAVTKVPDELGDPPDGQQGRLICGVVTTAHGVALMVDVSALDEYLDEVGGPDVSTAELVGAVAGVTP